MIWRHNKKYGQKRTIKQLEVVSYYTFKVTDWRRIKQGDHVDDNAVGEDNGEDDEEVKDDGDGEGRPRRVGNSSLQLDSRRTGHQRQQSRAPDWKAKSKLDTYCEEKLEWNVCKVEKH